MNVITTLCSYECDYNAMQLRMRLQHCTVMEPVTPLARTHFCEVMSVPWHQEPRGHPPHSGTEASALKAN